VQKKKIFIHAGAHRTGTSSFQYFLDKNRDVLTGAGYDLAYPARDGAQEGTLGLGLPQPRHGMDQQRRFAKACRRDLARQMTEGARGLILSEENLPGRMMHFYNGQFFPAAAARFDALRRGLPTRVKHLIYVVRRYDGLFASAYRKRAEENQVPPWDDIRERMVGMQEGYSDLMQVIVAQLRPKRITVVEYGKRGESRDLLGVLLPRVPEGLVEPERVLNVSATDAALFALQKLHRDKATVSPEMLSTIMAEHAENKENLGFASFDAAETAQIEARYARDLEVIEAMPEVNLIR